MENWKESKLSDIIDLAIGGDWGKDDLLDLGEQFTKVKCVRGSEYRNWERDKGRTAVIRQIKKDSLKKRKLQEGDILVEISGGGPEQPVGRTVIIDRKTLANADGMDLVCTNFLRLIRAKEIVFKPYLQRFLEYFYESGEVVKYQGGSNNLRNLKFKEYITILIPYPPFFVQQKIVAKIEELFAEIDNGIAALEKAKEQLETYRQSVLKAAFEGKLTNNNVKDGELPKGWEWVNIKEIIADEKHAMKAGPFGSALKKSDYTKKGFKIYGQEQVISGDYKKGDYYVGKVKYEQLKSCRVKANDVLISLVGTVGKTLILPNECEDGIINPRLIKITLNTDKYIPEFFVNYFQSSTVKAFQKMNASGTTMDVLNMGLIKKIPFPLCSLEEQRKLVNELSLRLNEIIDSKENINRIVNSTKLLKQSILKQAFTGKLTTE